jgi:hypothetical protein
MLAEMRRQLTAIQNGMNEDLIKVCPSMFTLAPAKGFTLLDTYLEHATQDEELDLTLYCEWEKQWHATATSVYRFRPEQKWFASLKEKWTEFSKVTKRVAPLAGAGGSLLGLPGVGAAFAGVAESAETLLAAGEKSLAGTLARELGMKQPPTLIDHDARHLLAGLIASLDQAREASQPKFGGLNPYHLKEDGRLLWLCADHRSLYENTR